MPLQLVDKEPMPSVAPAVVSTDSSQLSVSAFSYSESGDESDEGSSLAVTSCSSGLLLDIQGSLGVFLIPKSDRVGIAPSVSPLSIAWIAVASSTSGKNRFQAISKVRKRA